MTRNSTCTECNIKKDITANNLCNICSAISISRQTIYNDKRRASRIALINNISDSGGDCGTAIANYLESRSSLEELADHVRCSAKNFLTR